MTLCALMACGGGGKTGAAPQASASASPSSVPTPSTTGVPSPPGEPFTTRLKCDRPVAATHGLALYALPITPPMLEVLDVSNPLKPAMLCTLGPAQGGRFDQVHNLLLFWIGDQLGSADLSSGNVVQNARLPVAAFEAAFSRDGATFAYRAFDDAAGTISTHLESGGYDRTLYTQAPIGGHGGPPPGQGPVGQLEFSPDGMELLDFDTFRPQSGPEKFLVYRIAGILGTYAPPDSFLIFHSNTASAGAWSPSGSTLYFFARGNGSAGEVDSLDASGQRQIVVSTSNGFFWPQPTPLGGTIVYDAYDSSAPAEATGGLPHLWSLDLAAHRASQLSSVVSSEPVFVTATVIWSNEETRCECGPGGASMPDGVILAHDITTGRESPVNTAATVPGIGGPSSSPASTGRVLDVSI